VLTLNVVTRERGQIPAVRIGLLGIITIAVYGSWYYSFGVLLDPIIADTGWGEAALTGAFGASMFLGGIASVLGGFLLDRVGSRVVFILAAIIGLVAFQLAASATSPATFALAGAVGGGAFSALGFYHVTLTSAVRITPRAATKAIAVLTIWGAFASAVFLPLSAWLVEMWGWRATLSAMTSSAVVALVLGAVFIDTRTTEMPGGRGLIAELREAMRATPTRQFIVATGLLGIGVGTILVYQVPAMTAAGLSLTAASFWAGFRGFSQLGGRLPLMPIVERLGTVGGYRLAVTSVAVGGVILAFAGTPALALAFALLVGFGVGASSPLQGMHARDLFGAAGLGTAMGALAMVFLVVGSMGPIAAGWLAETTGSRAIPVLASALVTISAVPLIRPASG
jgi:MFS family permease